MSDEEPTMKKRVPVGVVLPLFALTTLSGSALSGQDRAGSEGIRGRFIGAWRLVWLEEPGADGKVQRADCTGSLVFTREGRMSVQVMYRHAQAGAAAGPVQYAQGGYEATFGRYEVNAGSRTFTYHVEGALVRRLVGKELTRSFDLSGNQLIVQSSNPSEH
jgi:hypothetical protein